MQTSDASFPRRFVAGVIGAVTCFVLVTISTMFWPLLEVVAANWICVCGPLEAAFWTSVLSSAALFLTLALYFVWSWSPLSGGRSLGKRAMGIRVVHER